MSLINEVIAKLRAVIEEFAPASGAVSYSGQGSIRSE
jgi:hypothetical protein